MKQKQQLTALIERDGEAYAAFCPEYDIGTQGDTLEAARANLREAVELFLEIAEPTEIERRRAEVAVTGIEVEFG